MINPEQFMLYQAAQDSLFREMLISSLVRAGALSKSDAARLCSDMATMAPKYLGPLEGSHLLLEATMDRWETLAAGYHGAGPKPKGL